jgi:hypothetical protein
MVAFLVWKAIVVEILVKHTLVLSGLFFIFANQGANQGVLAAAGARWQVQVLWVCKL